MRAPDAATEQRLNEIRREAELKGRVDAKGIRPAGAPIPETSGSAGYYGLPLLKAPVWTWEIPVYFFIGGAAGASAVIALAAQLSGADERLVRDARWVAAIGANLSAPLLISDLGRPERFLNMMRVFKPQSPMSVGAWILSAFGAGATGAVILPRQLGNAAAALSAASGLGMATYTGVLLGATAIPVWAGHASTLPAHFAASGMASAVSLLELRGHYEPALNGLAIAAAAFETLMGVRIELDRGIVSQPLRRGASGAITTIGGVLSGPVPLLLRAVARKSKKTRRLAAVCSLVGSLLTRLAWLAAGRASARDPRPALQLDRRDAARVRDEVGERAPAGQRGEQEAEPSRQQ